MATDLTLQIIRPLVYLLYARLLYTKLLEWVQNDNAIVEEHIGQRGEQSTLDHYMVLHHPFEKYSARLIPEAPFLQSLLTLNQPLT